MYQSIRSQIVGHSHAICNEKTVSAKWRTTSVTQTELCTDLMKQDKKGLLGH